jgi:hypothetical protein
VKILVLVPTKPTLCSILKQRSHVLTSRLPDANPNHELTVIHDYRKIEPLPTDNTPWARVTRARQQLLDSIHLLIFKFDCVLWIDADVIEYPADMPSRLIKANPDGIAAPMVFVEGQLERFYDWAAFLQNGSGHIEPANGNQIPGRNLSHNLPYWQVEPKERIVSMDCVGTIVSVPVNIMSGHIFVDHPCFTDWFTLCKRAKKIHGDRGVVVDRDVVAVHADLGSGKYEGEGWH